MAEQPKNCPGETCHTGGEPFARDDTGAKRDEDVDWISILENLPRFFSQSPVGIESIPGRVMGPRCPCLRKRELGKRGYTYHIGLQDEAVNVGRRVHVPEGGIWTTEVCRWGRFSQRIQVQVGESKNLEVASLESCQLGISPGIGWPCGKT